MPPSHARDDEPRYAAYDPEIAGRLLAFLRPYRVHVAAGVGLLVLSAGIEVAQPWLVKRAIDRHIAVGDMAGLGTVAAAYLGLLVAEAAVDYWNTYLTSWVGQRAMHDLRERLFDRLHRLPVAYFDRAPVGRLVTRVTTDVEVLNELFSSGVVAAAGDAVLLVAVLVTMLLLDWRLTLVTLSVLPLVFLVSIRFRVRVREAYREIRRRVAELNAYLQERVGGLVVVQLFRRERESAEGFARINRAHRDAQLRSVHHYALFYPLVEILGSVSVALLLWYGGAGIVRGSLTFGALVAFLQYAQKFFRPIRDLAEKYNLLQAAMASGERLIELLDEPPAPGPRRGGVRSLPEPRGEIVFDDVWFRYEPGPWVLEGIDVRVEAGARLALVGSTGAGKTTIVSLLCRFYEPDRGRILLDGVDVRDYPLSALRERIGLVSQDVFLFSGTVRENVRLGARRIDDRRVDAALAAIGADRFVDALPEGPETRVGERGRSLSTGEKQLVAFARALAFDPPVLVLDEATSSVDAETEATIEAAVARLMAGRTSVVVAHRLSTIRRVDRILVLHHGEVREEGDHASLLAAGGIYARLYALQYAGRDGAGRLDAAGEPR